MWNSLPLVLPTDQEEVWIRIKYYYGPPFLATWTTATQQFTSSINSIIYPTWTVARWKSQ